MLVRSAFCGPDLDNLIDFKFLQCSPAREIRRAKCPKSWAFLPTIPNYSRSSDEKTIKRVWVYFAAIAGDACDHLRRVYVRRYGHHTGACVDEIVKLDSPVWRLCRTSARRCCSPSRTNDGANAYQLDLQRDNGFWRRGQRYDLNFSARVKRYFHNFSADDHLRLARTNLQ